MTTTNRGPAGIKMRNERENGESRTPPKPQLVEQEVEAHLTHSFEWCWNNKRPTTITCNKEGTFEDVLKRSSQFRRDAEKPKDKDLVIMTDGNAISSHFPCRLVENEHLILKHVKAVNKLKKGVSSRVTSRKKEPSSNLVMFRVFVKGGKNVMKILTNPVLKAKIQKVIICEYKGKKVKQTRKRNGHLLNMKFIMNCALSERSTKVTTEMSNLIDDLGGITFQIIFLDKSSPPDSQNSSQQSIADLENNNLPRKIPKLCLATKIDIVQREIPGSKYLYSKLSSKSKNSMKYMKTQFPRLSQIHNLFRVKFGKNVKTCREVKTMKLKEFYDSVCQVRINETSIGSGFLLFVNFALTNAHVINDIYNDVSRQLNKKVTVNFSYDDLKQPVGESIEVEEVVGYEYNPDVPARDWALLRISANNKLPRPLAAHFGFLPKSGAICIIGHPGDGVKKIDPCLIVPTENRIQVVERHYVENEGHDVQEILDIIDKHPSLSLSHYSEIKKMFFTNMALSVQQQHITYKSHFYHGSSGSPVFDKYCNVVAMHSGGYKYLNASGQRNVIEYGHALSDIMEHMIIQMVEREKFDVLKDFLTCGFAQCNNILINVKKLVDRRNLTTFKNVVSRSVNINDTILKDFFKFFSHVEPPVPMEIDYECTDRYKADCRLRL